MRKKLSRYRKARIRQLVDLETGADPDGPNWKYDLTDPDDAEKFAKLAVKHWRYVRSKAQGKRPGKPTTLTAADRKLEAQILRDTRVLSKSIGRTKAIKAARDRFLTEGKRPLALSTIDRKLGNRL